MTIPEDIEKNFGATGCLWQKVGEKDRFLAREGIGGICINCNDHIAERSYIPLRCKNCEINRRSVFCELLLIYASSSLVPSVLGMIS